MKLTAKEARELSGKTPEEHVDDVCDMIRAKCNNKQLPPTNRRSLRLDNPFWVDGGYSKTKEWQEGVKLLQGLGYEVSFEYNAGQFVDMYTLVKW